MTTAELAARYTTNLAEMSSERLLDELIAVGRQTSSPIGSEAWEDARVMLPLVRAEAAARMACSTARAR